MRPALAVCNQYGRRREDLARLSYGLVLHGRKRPGRGPVLYRLQRQPVYAGRHLLVLFWGAEQYRLLDVRLAAQRTDF